jgi:hypothetical protein
MNTALWIIAGLLAVAFLVGGAMKIIQPKAKLVASGWGVFEDFSAAAVKAIGTLEVLAAVGLTIPAVVGVAPVLVPLAAVGIVMLMVGAITFHLRRHEASALLIDVTVLALAAVVAWGRFGPQPFAG